MFSSFLPGGLRALHTTAPSLAGATARTGSRKTASVIRKKNILEQAKRSKLALADRPSVVLGTRPSEEAIKWPKCDLARVLVDEEALYASPSTSSGASSSSSSGSEATSSSLVLPAQPAFGVASPETSTLLFNHLPQISARANVAAAEATHTSFGNIESSERKLERAEDTELRKTQGFARVVDLRNANAAGIAFENRRRIIEAFSTPENPFDPGRAEVQAALKTYQIRKLWTHLTTYKRDVGNRLGLRKLVHERAKILRYLRNTNRDRYEIVLERLALEPEAVEGELVV